MNGSIYERELANILSGDPNVVMKYSRRASISVESREGIVKSPFFIVRAAGSLGADLIALRHDVSLIIEVKSSARDTLTFSEASGQRQEQAERLSRMSETAGMFLTYAYRIKNVKGDPWRLFCLGKEPAGGLRFLYRLLPKPGITSNGNYKLVWNEGFPLSSFFTCVNQK